MGGCLEVVGQVGFFDQLCQMIVQFFGVVDVEVEFCVVYDFLVFGDIGGDDVGVEVYCFEQGDGEIFYYGRQDEGKVVVVEFVDCFVIDLVQEDDVFVSEFVYFGDVVVGIVVVVGDGEFDFVQEWFGCFDQMIDLFFG